MPSSVPIWFLMTTYQRTDIAIKTIRGIKENFLYDNIGWVITDDSTGGDHLQRLKDEIGGSYSIVSYDNEKHLGVGHNMNWGLRKIWEMGADLTIMLEDDWYLEKPFDPTPAVNLLMRNPKVGMVKWGYLSAGANADVVSEEKKLWLKFNQNGYTYIYTGHASLRHKRLHQQVGMFTEGLRPGDNELDFCGKYNATPNAPDIYWQLDYGHIGPFVHIGDVSLSNIPVG
jgi:hypothetical protein